LTLERIISARDEVTREGHSKTKPYTCLFHWLQHFYIHTMPVTRSSSHKPSSRHSALISSPRRKPGGSSATVTAGDSDIIVLSDGEEYPKPKPKRTSTSNPKTANDKQRGKARAKPLVPIGEVVEISSEDERPAENFSIIADLQKQVQNLQKENTSLKTARKHDKKNVVLDISKLEDHISCEICTIKLWRPFILPECGHTFCQSCLEDWFNTTLAQHMVAHPNYNANAQNQSLNSLPRLIYDYLARNNVAQQDQLRLRAMFPHHGMPTPQYTCPTCRKQVKNRPVEDFALKSLVRAIAGAAGEPSPKKLGGEPKTAIGRTWDGFFPASDSV